MERVGLYGLNPVDKFGVWTQVSEKSGSAAKMDISYSIFRRKTCKHTMNADKYVNGITNDMNTDEYHSVLEVTGHQQNHQEWRWKWMF